MATASKKTPARKQAPDKVRFVTEVELAKIIVRARKDKKLTQYEVADKVGLVQPMISAAENTDLRGMYRARQQIASLLLEKEVSGPYFKV